MQGHRIVTQHTPTQLIAEPTSAALPVLTPRMSFSACGGCAVTPATAR